MREEPEKRRRRHGDDVVLDEAGERHDQDRRAVAAVAPQRAEEAGEAERHHRLAEQLRVIHADVAVGKAADGDEEDGRADPSAEPAAAEPPHAEGDRDGDARRPRAARRAAPRARDRRGAGRDRPTMKNESGG